MKIIKSTYGFNLKKKGNNNNDFEIKVRKICNEVANLLIEKNKSYGNAALDPIRCFSKLDSTQQLLVRIDDKLSRIMRGNEFSKEDTVKDLLGYLVLLKVAQEK